MPKKPATARKPAAAPAKVTKPTPSLAKKVQTGRKTGRKVAELPVRKIPKAPVGRVPKARDPKDRLIPGDVEDLRIKADLGGLLYLSRAPKNPRVFNRFDDFVPWEVVDLHG